MFEGNHNFFYVHQSEDLQQYDIHELFTFYDSYFFHGALQGCQVRWANRMTLCAGTCTYKGGSHSVISLSEPLLKLRSNN